MFYANHQEKYWLNHAPTQHLEHQRFQCKQVFFVTSTPVMSVIHIWCPHKNKGNKNTDIMHTFGIQIPCKIKSCQLENYKRS